MELIWLVLDTELRDCIKAQYKKNVDYFRSLLSTPQVNWDNIKMCSFSHIIDGLGKSLTLCFTIQSELADRAKGVHCIFTVF